MKANRPIDLMYFLPAIGWFFLIFWLSTTGTINMPISVELSPDKIGHLVFYAVLVYLILWGFDQNGIDTQKKRWWIMLLAALYGLSLEVVQYAFFPRRLFDWLDALANVLGALLGIWVFARFHIKRTK